MVIDRLPCPIIAETMSTYLLLRNNKETGPFTVEEIKQMSLKPYDLLWAVGKSAAWRYPGEINELKTFAPPIPEKPNERVNNNPKSESPVQEPGLKSKESPTVLETNAGNAQSVYVNHPAAERKTSSIPASDHFPNETLPYANSIEPSFSYGQLNSKPSRAVRLSSKVIWVSTILLLFGTAILTGLFISDRRNFFSSYQHKSQEEKISAQSQSIGNKKNSNIESASEILKPVMDSVSDIQVKPVYGNATLTGGRKKLKSGALKKDSILKQTTAISPINLYDSALKQKAPNDNEALYKKMKAHPENYINLVTGKYSVGIFGGISSVPITVTNNSPVRLDMVIVSIDYIQSNGKIFKTENLTYYDLEPGESVTEKTTKSSRGVKITQHLSMVNSRQLDLTYSN